MGDEAGTAVVRLAAEIRRRRHAAGLSQPQLAGRVGYTRQYVSLAERVSHNLPSRELVAALDAALNAGGELVRLREQARAEQNMRRQAVTAGASQTDPGLAASVENDVVRAMVPRLRRVLAAHDLPEDGPVRPLAALEAVVGRMVERRVEARYVQIAEDMPDLLVELLRALHDGRGDARRQAARLVTHAYRAADGIAFKFGYTDLSSRIIDLMRSTATEADDPILVASTEYVRTETFFATRDLDTALHALVRAADEIPSRMMTTPVATATYGSLHMRAAVVAGRAGNGDQARDHLAEARRAAAGLAEDVYLGTAFGPSSVKIHDVAVAVELDDGPTAVEQAGAWQPPEHLPAERRSHYYIDLARAQLAIGRADDAFGALRTARQIAPQHVREHPQVRRSLATLLHTGRTDADLVNFATWARVTDRS